MVRGVHYPLTVATPGLDEVTMSEQEQAAMPAKTGKRTNWVISHAISGSIIKFTVKDVKEVIELDVEKVHEKIRARAAIHGLVQRISDAAAIPRDEETGKSATPEEKHAAMARLVAHYVGGAESWTLNREGAGGTRAVAGVQLLREALELWQPEKGAEKIAAWVKGLKPQQVAALMASQELKPHIDAVREKYLSDAGQGVDAEELLSSL